MAPNLGYGVKWFAVQLLPIGALGIFGICHMVRVVQKRCLLNKRDCKELNSHSSGLIAMCVIMMYYMYLLLLRFQLDIFNCNPTVPDDGFTYVGFVDLSCDGLCRCWDFSPSGWGLQAQLLLPSMICFVLYTIGFHCAYSSSYTVTA